MAEGITLRAEKKPRGWGEKAFFALCALLCYGALWGSLSDMASLSTAGALPLLAGGAALAAVALAPKGRWLALLLCAGGLAALLLSPDGGKLLLNRLMTASAQRQAYEYQLFPVAAEDAAGTVARGLLPMGLITGGLLGMGAAKRLPPVFAGSFALFAAGAAYLGVTPRWTWCALWAAASLLALLRPSLGAAAGVCAAVGMIAAAVLILAPGEDPALSQWEELVRDRLAAETMAFTHDLRQARERRHEAAPPPQAAELYAEEETLGKPGGEQAWPIPPAVAGVIALFALALFVPAFLEDRAKRRHRALEACLTGTDDGEAVKAAFLYAVRWLELGGFQPENLPEEAAAEQLPPIEKAAFLQALPLWREAAYSAHPIGGEQRARMGSYLEETKTRVWSRLNARQRLLARYRYGLVR